MGNYLSGRKPQPMTEKMRRAAAMSAEGATISGIAEELGISKSTVSRFFDRDDVTELRAKLIKKKIHRLAGKALAVLERNLESDASQGWLAYNSAIALYKAFETDVNKSEQDAGTAVVFESMPTPGAPASAELPGGTDDGYEETIEGEIVEGK